MMMVVLGCGESGFGAAMLARKIGMPVFVSDGGRIREEFRRGLIESEIDFEEDGHAIIYDIIPQLVVQSPGIPDDAPVVAHFRKQGVEVISEIELAYRHCRGKVVAITGSNGKTTTTNLVHHILETAGLDAVKVGNVGYSFCRSLASEEHAVYVVEVSSFQLDTISAFRPHIAVILNITPDHLDRYRNDMALYAAAKFRIAMKQGPQDHLILYRDAGIEKYYHPHHDGPEVEWIEADLDQSDRVTVNGAVRFSFSDSRLKGRHNAMNAACAAAACRHLGVSDELIQRAIDSFVNDAHRLEFIAEVDGVKYINDSKATNVDSVYWALDAMRTGVVWIAGGQDKGNDYSVIDDLVRQKVRALVAMGLDNTKLLQHFEGMVQVYDTHGMEEAVRVCSEKALSGDVVLLSPACASFDLFRNYMHRGDEFRHAVMKLKTRSAV